MKIFVHNKCWISRTGHIHVDPLPIPLIKRKAETNSDKIYVKIKLHRNHTLETSDMYEFKMALLDKDYP